MSFDWQTPLALICVAAAAVYLIRYGWRSRRQSGCGHCSGPADVGVKRLPLVSLSSNLPASPKAIHGRDASAGSTQRPEER